MLLETRWCMAVFEFIKAGADIRTGSDSPGQKSIGIPVKQYIGYISRAVNCEAKMGHVKLNLKNGGVLFYNPVQGDTSPGLQINQQSNQLQCMILSNLRDSAGLQLPMNLPGRCGSAYRLVCKQP